MSDNHVNDSLGYITGVACIKEVDTYTVKIDGGPTQTITWPTITTNPGQVLDVTEKSVTFRTEGGMYLLEKLA